LIFKIGLPVLQASGVEHLSGARATDHLDLPQMISHEKPNLHKRDPE